MTRRDFLGGAAAAAAAGCVSVDSLVTKATASAWLEARKKWFKEAQFGMMAHWGLYTLLGGEWNGKPGRHAYGEWIQWGEKIPMREYGALAKAFNPILFNPKEWMKRACDAGMRYFVFTSKHHDGFAMYRSWGYRPTDVNYRSVDEVKAIKAKCASIGSNYMLNIGPDPLGRIPAGAISILDGLKG